MIKHRQDYRSITLQEDYLQICNGNICQALILSVLEALVDENDSDIAHVPMNYKDFMYELFGQYTRQTLSTAISQLLERKFIERIPHTDSYDYVYDYRISLATVQEQIDQLPPKAARRKPIAPEFLNNIAGRHQAAWDMFGGLCAYCRVARATTWDHVIPRSKNGRNTKSNLVPACRECNMYKGDQDVQKWMKVRGITPCDQLMEIINKITQNNNVDGVVGDE